MLKMQNQFGKTSLCSVQAGYEEDRTKLEKVSFTAPFKIMSPFYEPDGFMHVMVLSASAGIMEGDAQEFFLEAKKGARLRFSAQAYEKIHKMKQGQAVRHTRLLVERGGILDYFSQPVIPFAQSAFSSTLEAELEDSTAALLYQEILSCGRAARGEEFQYRFYRNLVSVRRQGKLIYRDNCCFEPQLMELQAVGMYEGFHHMGSFLAFGIEEPEEKIAEIRSLLDQEEHLQGGATKITEHDLAVRVLGNRAQELEEFFEKIKGKVLLGY